MTYKSIDFMSQSEIHYLEPDSQAIVISITNPHMPKARVEGFKDVLYQQFDNTSQLHRNLIRFNLKNAEEILNFVEQYKESADKIIINCLQGESRSAAIALYLSKKMNLPLTRNTDKFSEWIYHVMERAERD